jgi:hypothetical protein
MINITPPRRRLSRLAIEILVIGVGLWLAVSWP